MSKTIKRIALSALAVVLVATAGVAIIKAVGGGSGVLTPPSGAFDNGAPKATMHSITEIYDKLATGTVDDPAHGLKPSGSPADGTYTLEDVYGIIPANSDVCSGTNGGTATCCEGGCGSPAIVWTSASISGLCWDTDPGNVWNTADAGGPYCDAASLGGWQTTPNLTPVGAVEYCTHLNTAGTALQDSVGIWRLPTESELLAGLSDQFILGLPSQTGFQGNFGYYWSGSENDSNYAWLASSDHGYVYSDDDGKHNQDFLVRCVH